MFKNLQYLSVAQRRFVFFVIFGGILLAFLGITAILINSALNSGERVVSIPLNETVTVREFAALPDDDAYPPALAVAADGTIYTGSFSTGAVYAITPAGVVSELPGTRESIGAFTGITVAPDGSLFIVDQEDTDPRSSGGKIWRWNAGTLAEVPAQLDTTGWVSPNDLAFDGVGQLYITDSGRNEVWRFNPDGTAGTIWWVPPTPPSDVQNQRRAVTGIAYDPVRDAMVMTDSEQSAVYRVAIADASTEIVYAHGNQADPPGFDGVTVTEEGMIYAAALGQNGIARVEPNLITYVAGLFRGASDVAYAPPGQLYVTNFDQASIVLPFVAPQLPFAIDVITLNAPGATPTP